MTPAQYMAQLHKLDLTPYAAGPVLSISRRQSIRYAQGDAPIPEAVAKLVRALVALPQQKEPTMKDTLTIDLRHRRAAALTSFIVHTVSKYICDCDRMRKPMRDLHEELFAEFHKSGVEIISDYDREAAGLPPRGPEGWTIEELIALDRRRMEIMMAPISMILPHKKEASDEPQPIPE